MQQLQVTSRSLSSAWPVAKKPARCSPPWSEGRLDVEELQGARPAGAICLLRVGLAGVGPANAQARDVQALDPQTSRQRLQEPQPQLERVQAQTSIPLGRRGAQARHPQGRGQRFESAGAERDLEPQLLPKGRRAEATDLLGRLGAAQEQKSGRDGDSQHQPGTQNQAQVAAQRRERLRSSSLGHRPCASASTAAAALRGSDRSRRDRFGGAGVVIWAPSGDRRPEGQGSD